VKQETRLYNVESGETVGMRSKKRPHDYRYFPERNLVPADHENGWRVVERSMPELARRPNVKRFIRHSV